MAANGCALLLREIDGVGGRRVREVHLGQVDLLERPAAATVKAQNVVVVPCERLAMRHSEQSDAELLAGLVQLVLHFVAHRRRALVQNRVPARAMVSALNLKQLENGYIARTWACGRRDGPWRRAASGRR